MHSSLTNQLDVSFNYEAIDKAFIIFQITTTEKYIPRGAYILDRPGLGMKALSVSFDFGRSAFVLFRRQGTIDKGRILSVLGDEKLSIKEVTSSLLQKHILFRLFLSSLANYSTGFLSFNNISGKLFLFSPEWISKNKKSFKALDIDVDYDLCLYANATTFSSTQLIKDKKLLKTAPQYVLEGRNYTLKRVLSSDGKEKAFIQKTLGDRRTEIPYLYLSPKSMKLSRCWYLFQTLDALNENYKEYLSAAFHTREITETLQDIREKEVIERVVSDFRFSSLNLVNADKCKSDNLFFQNLSDALMDIISPNAVQVSDSVDPEKANIVFLHNADYYKENGYVDIYRSLDRTSVIQCVTKEDVDEKINEGSPAILKTCLKELVIKDDILHKHRISLDCWEDLGFDKDWVFGIESDGEQYFMTIQKEGLFTLTHKRDDFSVFEDKQLNKLSLILSQSENKTRTIISDGNGDIILISRTNINSLPSPAIFSGERIRSKEGREQYLSGVTDINLYEDKNESFYSVGPIGYGMNSSISKGPLLYRVETIEGNNIIRYLLRTMSVLFVKYNEFTVLPYPVKYLREYMRLVGIPKKEGPKE